MKNNFSMVPTPSELDAMKRDLKFYPSSVTEPQTLSRDHISSFNEQGYIRGIRIFSNEEIAEIRKYFDALLEKVTAEGGDSYSISSAHLKYGRVHDILTHPRIVSHVKDVLGDNVIGWGSHFFCKMPGDGKAVAWHQDSSYWPLTPSKTVTVWLAVDDADRENACMEFIAGSHWKGHLTYRPSQPEDHNVLNQTIENPEQYGGLVHDVLKAGEISIHSDLLLHGSQTNLSNRRRCGLTLRYCSPDVRAGVEWNQKGVWVSGSDPAGHWANRPRPNQD